MFGRRNPPPWHRLTRLQGPSAIHFQRSLVNADLLYLQLPIGRDHPEIDEVSLLRILRIVKLDVGEETVAVDGTREIDIIEDQFELLRIAFSVEATLLAAMNSRARCRF